MDTVQGVSRRRVLARLPLQRRSRVSYCYVQATTYHDDDIESHSRGSGRSSIWPTGGQYYGHKRVVGYEPAANFKKKKKVICIIAVVMVIAVRYSTAKVALHYLALRSNGIQNSLV